MQVDDLAHAQQGTMIMSGTPISHPDWAVQAGGKATTYGRGIAKDGGGGALVTGFFYGVASFGLRLARQCSQAETETRVPTLS